MLVYETYLFRFALVAALLYLASSTHKATPEHVLDLLQYCYWGAYGGTMYRTYSSS